MEFYECEIKQTKARYLYQITSFAKPSDRQFILFNSKPVRFPKEKCFLGD